MVKNQLRDLLNELHDSLSDIDQLDEETRQAMESLTGDLQRILGKSGDLSADEVESFRGQLQEALLRFETEHPQISGILGRMASSLANLGI